MKNSLPAQGQLILEAAEETTDGIVFRVRVKGAPHCPACSESHVSFHSRYVRRLRDLPWQGKPVEIHLQTRRFRCRNKECARKVFAERLPALADRRARETARLCEIVGVVGYALGGCPVSDSFIGWESKEATIPCYAESKHEGGQLASRKCEC